MTKEEGAGVLEEEDSTPGALESSGNIEQELKSADTAKNHQRSVASIKKERGEVTAHSSDQTVLALLVIALLFGATFVWYYYLT